MKKNQSIFKSNKESPLSSKSNVVKIPQKRGRKTTPSIFRPSLPKYVGSEQIDTLICMCYGIWVIRSKT
ncbi:hypothetical protein H5410_016485 [Solanum commersonii]|uniref:Uncharacterized protein n=1 Tax=Solanum commersonii TaxID=4109 RepID=A0A9J5ZWD0_SOLCO|nr:hypothetical protein H5410_016485 [Solanum commersonii]